ncbi:zinc-ribbon domain-containing protein [Bacillaceae bacterium Marseille-Q3522]|nr:zinc-ribbon domain-containing protein [Bacillaceae bacterium Marseille-Q3522]
MQYCKNCGKPLKESAAFCAECGAPVSSEEKETFQRSSGHIQKTAVKKSSKKQKVILGVILGIAVLLFAFYQVGAQLTKKDRVIDQLHDAIVNKDESTLANLLVSEDPSLKINVDNLGGFLRYMEENPQTLSDLTQALKAQSGEESSAGEYGLLTLKKEGKYWLFFDKYQFAIQPFYYTVYTNFSGTVLSMDDNEIATADTDDYSKEFGPYLPGIYSFKAEYHDDYADLESTEEINSFDYNQYADVDLTLDSLFVEIDTDFSDAALYVNGKNTGQTAEEAGNFGPIGPGSTMQLVKAFPWGEEKTEEATVEEGSSYVELYFHPTEDGLMKTLGQVVSEYQKSEYDSYLTMDPSKLVHAASDFSAGKADEIQSSQEFGDAFFGTGVSKIVIDLDSTYIRYDEDREIYSVDIQYLSTINGEWSRADASEEEINEMKATEEEVGNEITLEYDEEAKEWLVTDHSETYWPIEIENGMEYTY